jgi:hypothetical protein
MLELHATSANKLAVFISYSRDDLGFADQLEEALKITGFSTTLDRHGISGGEDWQGRLGALIRDADTVVFVLSPASAKSEICAWEVAEAVRLNKRILPVLPRSLDGQTAPKQLAQLNYIFFYDEPKFPGSGFGTGLSRLVAALNTDLDWLREHTRLLQRATEWEVGGRPANRLLSGSDISAAKAWAARRPRDAPEPTALHLDFLRASEHEEAVRVSAERKRLDEMAAAQAERQAAIEEREAAVKREAAAQKERTKARRIIAWVSSGAAVVIVIGSLLFAFQQRRNTKEQAVLTASAQEQRAEAVRQKAEAEKQTALAQSEKDELENLIRRIRVGRSNEPGMNAMKRICNEAIEVTSTLASTPEENTHATQENRFWELYYGPMNLIEIRQKTDRYFGDHTIILSGIETAMVHFGSKLKQLKASAALPHSSLGSFSSDIKRECDAYLP